MSLRRGAGLAVMPGEVGPILFLVALLLLLGTGNIDEGHRAFVGTAISQPAAAGANGKTAPSFRWRQGTRQWPRLAGFRIPHANFPIRIAAHQPFAIGSVADAQNGAFVANEGVLKFASVSPPNPDFSLIIAEVIARQVVAVGA